MTLRCDLCVARTADGYLVRVQGKGTMAHSPALAEFVKGCLDEDEQSRVAVDLHACEYLDSTFLGCLLKLQRAGTAERFQVVADDSTRKRLLTNTSLDKYLTLVADAPTTSGQFLRIGERELSSQQMGRHMMETHRALGELPSGSASAFKRIAAQLEKELEPESRDAPSLFDTAIFPPAPRQ